MNAGGSPPSSRVVRAPCRFGSGERALVVGLFAPGERVRVVAPGRKEAELLNGAAAAGTDDGREVRGVDPELVVPIMIEVQPLVQKILVAPKLRLGQCELLPDGVTQMRQIQTAEDAVPVRIIA